MDVIDINWKQTLSLTELWGRATHIFFFFSEQMKNTKGIHSHWNWVLKELKLEWKIFFINGENSKYERTEIKLNYPILAGMLPPSLAIF